MIEEINIIDGLKKHNRIKSSESNNNVYIVREIQRGKVLVEAEGMGKKTEILAEDIEGIHLTEEFLIKHGFEKKPGNQLWYQFSHPIGINILYESPHTIFFITWLGRELVEIKYIHQLQNFFSLLTGYHLLKPLYS